MQALHRVAALIDRLPRLLDRGVQHLFGFRGTVLDHAGGR